MNQKTEAQLRQEICALWGMVDNNKEAFNAGVEFCCKIIESDKYGIGSMLSQWTNEEVAEDLRMMGLIK